MVDTIEMEFAHKNAPHKPNSKHDSASTKGESYLPFKQLFHFDRQHVPKQQTTSFTIPMTRQAFTLYDSKGQGVCAPGVYTITVTNGVDESVKGRVTVVGKERMVVPFPTKQT